MSHCQSRIPIIWASAITHDRILIITALSHAGSLLPYWFFIYHYQCSNIPAIQTHYPTSPSTCWWRMTRHCRHCPLGRGRRRWSPDRLAGSSSRPGPQQRRRRRALRCILSWPHWCHRMWGSTWKHTSWWQNWGHCLIMRVYLHSDLGVLAISLDFTLHG